jgi:hypothetical protein
MHLLADEARLADVWQPLASTKADTNSQGRALATLDGTRESYRRRAIVALRMTGRPGSIEGRARATESDRRAHATSARPPDSPRSEVK